eukprot:CAMPEP_0201535476 /NCGR_PEP_ID=MMETSP0161_2-20130828/59152_1 /ASSEMBLY_ACC=CAM_ASM_000251 /TAXON_ID=180227 /ORGANISM="Neoparamoeba aestuarina, Strain SoJaBio B1-5/56/2" /LENGTH=64 /DNA_ID=CAMNT_0047940675 /DNA_START=410 /DNA_END=601 /DNA_ORIENTATION=-
MKEIMIAKQVLHQWRECAQTYSTIELILCDDKDVDGFRKPLEVDTPDQLVGRPSDSIDFRFVID